MRSFIKQIERNSWAYEPQFINIDEYNSIILASQENYTVDVKGKNMWMWNHK